MQLLTLYRRRLRLLAGNPRELIVPLATPVWFVGAVALLTMIYASLAEVMAYRLTSEQEYIGNVPAIAIVPWFFAGSLFPISVLPKGLAIFAKILPGTHALALMRHGLTGGSA